MKDKERLKHCHPHHQNRVLSGNGVEIGSKREAEAKELIRFQVREQKSRAEGAEIARTGSWSFKEKKAGHDSKEQRKLSAQREQHIARKSQNARKAEREACGPFLSQL
jgi:hypothetical protein